MLFVGGPLHGQRRTIGASSVLSVPVFKPVDYSVGAATATALPVTVHFERVDYMRAGLWGTSALDAIEMWTPGGRQPAESMDAVLAGAPVTSPPPELARLWAAVTSPPPLPAAPLSSPDAHRYDASRDEAEAEMAEWRAVLDGAKRVH